MTEAHYFAIRVGKAMDLYKFYWLDEAGEEHFIGVRTERRKSGERITNESILNWGRQIDGSDPPHAIRFAMVRLRFLRSGTVER